MRLSDHTMWRQPLTVLPFDHTQGLTGLRSRVHTRDMKPTSSTPGHVTLANGERRFAWSNTSRRTVFSADGATATQVTDTRIEFELDTNAATGRGRQHRKVSTKQAATFTAR